MKEDDHERKKGKGRVKNKEETQVKHRSVTGREENIGEIPTLPVTGEGWTIEF